jgi:hypothetical protein
VQSEKDSFGHFVEENPNILLPMDGDVQVNLVSDPLNECEGLESQTKVLLKNPRPYYGQR